MPDKETIDYIIRFLCANKSSAFEEIAYVKDYKNTSCSVVIKQSNFFDDGIYGTCESDPLLPLALLENVPVLFGEPVIERKESQIIIHADLVASVYYLISRYEEMIKPNIRDQHGRFPGRESLPYRAKFIDKPIVEEYGKIIRQCLRETGIEAEEPIPGFSHIYLTHDVDCPWEHFTFVSACKRILGELKRGHGLQIYPLKNVFGKPESDPRYTFQNLLTVDKTVPDAESIFFIKSIGRLLPEDYFPYIEKKGTKKLLQLLNSNRAQIGYHVSYAAGRKTDLIAEELKVLRSICNKTITMSRNHYLASIEPHDFNTLIENGITDDFTMGYADVAGFRLGTCRAVQWIDPETKCLTKLVLHPLEIMECTLTSDNYMALNEEQSQQWGKKIIDNVFLNGGEISLLWHNNENIGKADSIDWKNYLYFLQILKSVYSRSELEER